MGSGELHGPRTKAVVMAFSSASTVSIRMRTPVHALPRTYSRDVGATEDLDGVSSLVPEYLVRLLPSFSKFLTENFSSFRLLSTAVVQPFKDHWVTFRVIGILPKRSS